VDLVCGMLEFNPWERIKPEEALKHPFFNIIEENENENLDTSQNEDLFEEDIPSENNISEIYSSVSICRN
jgi:serine/threonine protein kinase